MKIELSDIEAIHIEYALLYFIGITKSKEEEVKIVIDVVKRIEKVREDNNET
jgi:hypothetical protein